jgi:1,4-dihydroxy-2-naphthoate octaprenyltransferase
MVLTVWYFSIDFGMALTVWYFLSFILLQSFTEFVQLYCDYQTYLGRKSW